MLREGMGSVSVWQHLGGGGREGQFRVPTSPAPPAPCLGCGDTGMGLGLNGIEWD